MTIAGPVGVKLTDMTVDGLTDISSIGTSIAVYHCDREGICVRTAGYIDDGGSGTTHKYYIHPTTEGSNTNEGDNIVSSCGASDSGKYDSTNSVYCIGGKESKAMDSIGNGYYLVKIGAVTEFSIVSTNNKIVSIIQTVSGITDGLNVINTKTLARVDITNSSTGSAQILSASLEDLLLFYCDTTSNLCRQTYGYIKSGDGSQYFSFPKVGAAAAVTSLVEECNDHQGALMTGNKLCIDTEDENAVDFISSGSATYVIGAVAGNVFTNAATDSYVVRAVPNGFVLNSLLSDNTKNYLVKTEGQYKFYAYTDTSSSVATTSGPSIMGYDVIIKDEVYKKVTAATDVSATSVLFSCGGGFCQPADGFAMVGTDMKKCNEEGCKEAESDATCATSGNSGKVLKTGGDKIQVCVGTTATSLDNSKVYYINTGSAYKRYISDAAESNIVGVVNSENGHYLINSGSEVITTEVSGNTLITCGSNGCTGTAVAQATAAIYVDENSKSDSTYGKVIKCTGSVCSIVAAGTTNKFYINGDVTNSLTGALIKDGSSFSIEDATDNGYYLNVDSTLIHCTSATGCTKVAAPKATDYYLDEATYNDGNDNYEKLIHCSNPTSCDTTAHTDGYYVNGDSGSPLILCAAGDLCNAYKVTVGYYKDHDTTTIYKCSGSTLTCATHTSSDACSASKIGNYKGSNGLCLDGTNVKEFDSVTPGYVLMTYLEGSIFNMVTSAEQYGLVKVNENTLAIEEERKSICVKTSDKSVQVKPGAGCDAATTKEYTCYMGVCSLKTESSTPIVIECDVKTGKYCSNGSYEYVGTTLYYCKEQDSPCHPVEEVGYYIIGETIYGCSLGLNGITCNDSLTIQNTCTGNAGEIIQEEDKLYLCLTENVKIEINNANSGVYAVAYKSGNVYGLAGPSNENYGIVTLKDNIVTLNSTYTNNRYVYINKSTNGNMKVLKKGTCPTDKTSAGILELKCKEGKCKEIA